MPGSSSLADLTVVDLSESIAGQFCARLFADVGARTVLVEPPIGSTIRYRGPYRTHGRRPDDSLLFFHLNAGKTGVTVDYRSASGKELLTGLLRDVDVVVMPGSTTDRRFVSDALGDQPRTIVCNLDDFDASSPLAEWTGSELVFQAMSGVMHENGRADLEPLYGCGNRSLYATGVMGYVATMSAVFERDRSGLGQSASATGAAVAASMNYNRGTQYWYNGSVEPRDDPATPRMTLECADGWVVAFANGPRWVGTCTAFGALDLLDDPTLQTEFDRLDRWNEIRARFQAAARLKTVNDIIGQAVRLHAVVARVSTTAELLTDPHLEQRGYWRSVEIDGERQRVLGGTARYGDIELSAARAPHLGEHNHEWYGKVGLSDDDLDILRDAQVI